jgi:hypothetical protein
MPCLVDLFLDALIIQVPLAGFPAEFVRRMAVEAEPKQLVTLPVPSVVETLALAALLVSGLFTRAADFVLDFAPERAPPAVAARYYFITTSKRLRGHGHLLLHLLQERRCHRHYDNKVRPILK